MRSRTATDQNDRRNGIGTTAWQCFVLAIGVLDPADGVCQAVELCWPRVLWRKSISNRHDNEPAAHQVPARHGPGVPHFTPEAPRSTMHVSTSSTLNVRTIKLTCRIWQPRVAVFNRPTPSTRTQLRVSVCNADMCWDRCYTRRLSNMRAHLRCQLLRDADT